MFNLIIAAAGWEPHRDTFPVDRIFEHTEGWISDFYKPNGVLDIGKIIQLPTLFMEEGTGDELAHVGRITRVQPQGANVLVEYAWDQRIPAISNRKMKELQRDFGLDDWEYSRTHWAIKQVNLFEVLYRSEIGAPIRPRVFNLPNDPVDPELVSVMMPFSAEFDGLYRSVGEACINIGMKCERADNIWLNDAVVEDIVHLIATSKIVVADLTGKNSNVFYEIGVAHTLGKDVILLTQQMDDVPFDLRHLRVLTYLNNDEGRAVLKDKLAKRLRKLA